MRTRLPTSRGALRLRLSLWDVVWAFVAPILALVLRDAYILNTADGLMITGVYCAIWFVFSLVFFQAFRLYDGLADHFSVHDAFDVIKAVICTELFTCLVFFTASRLDGIPRTTPIIHALILGAGLIATRAIAQAFSSGRKRLRPRQHVAIENLIVIGANRVSSLYIKLIEASAPGARRVLAILDEKPRLIGRSMAGVRILGAPHQLESIIEEFVVHGIRTDRVIVGTDLDSLPDGSREQIRQICARRDIRLHFIDEVTGLPDLPITPPEKLATLTPDTESDFELPRYFAFRRFFDPLAAMALIILLLPMFIMAAALTLIDVGTPVLFWQQRLGRNGRPFLLYKFRSLRAPYDRRGREITDREQLSFIGRVLRQTRCDELPQLFNVLVGDMALIGPRPLLPEDQPTNPAMRLIARPGITGWAQVNGGKFLTPEEKDQYDEFYIRNVSVWFDLRILYRTLQVLFRTGSQSDHKVAADDRVGFGKKDVASTARRPRPIQPGAIIQSPSLRPTEIPTVRFPRHAGHKQNPIA